MMNMSNKAITCMVLIVTMLSTVASSKEITIEIYKKKFIPAEVSIEQGDTVTWINKEKRQYHNVWFKQLDKEEPDYLFPQETYTKSFNELGDYPYECGPHPKMKGVIQVKKPTK